MEKDFIKWFKSQKCGFVVEKQIPEHIKPSLYDYLEHSNRVGVYVYHSHIMKNNSLVFDGMTIGYYVRGKNPFKWNFWRTAGNH